MRETPGPPGSGHLSLPPRVQTPNTYALLVVVLLQVLLQRIGKRQCVDAVVRGAAADDGATDVLQAEGLRPVDGVRQQGLEEHAGIGILVVLEEARDGRRVEHAGVVHVEAEVVVPLLDARVQRAAVSPEADGEQVVLLRGVAEQKRAFGFALQQRLGLVPIHDAPVTGQVRDSEQVGHQTVDVIDLRVYAMLSVL